MYIPNPKLHGHLLVFVDIYLRTMQLGLASVYNRRNSCMIPRQRLAMVRSAYFDKGDRVGVLV